ncbi:MAG TPA: energy transducer TonB, partial [Bacteroidales bacterium]|nr:energy transducer TonB [Bacteroidales bacterium]
QGTVYVTFVVEKNGAVTDVRVLRGIGGGCDEEAIRVIQAMPKWNAGKQRGKPVRVQFNMPIKFTLQG